LNLQLGNAVVRVAPDATGFTVSGEDEVFGRFERMISAIPVVQARAMLADVLAPGAQAGPEMAPCWTLMAAFDHSSGVPVRDGLSLEPIAQPGPPGRWVVHARPEWSIANLQRPAEEVQAELLAALQARLGLGAPLVAMVHRWLYARTVMPLGAPFHAAQGGRVLVGGDWGLGRDADHAFASGAAMARAMMG